MAGFLVIETDDGLTVVEHPEGQSPDEVAIDHKGLLADPHSYPTYDEAYDAMLAIQQEEDEDQMPPA